MQGLGLGALEIRVEGVVAVFDAFLAPETIFCCVQGLRFRVQGPVSGLPGPGAFVMSLSTVSLGAFEKVRTASGAWSMGLYVPGPGLFLLVKFRVSLAACGHET